MQDEYRSLNLAKRMVNKEFFNLFNCCLCKMGTIGTVVPQWYISTRTSDVILLRQSPSDWLYTLNEACCYMTPFRNISQGHSLVCHRLLALRQAVTVSITSCMSLRQVIYSRSLNVTTTEIPATTCSAKVLPRWSIITKNWPQISNEISNAIR